MKKQPNILMLLFIFNVIGACKSPQSDSKIIELETQVALAESKIIELETQVTLAESNNIELDIQVTPAEPKIIELDIQVTPLYQPFKMGDDTILFLENLSEESIYIVFDEILIYNTSTESYIENLITSYTPDAFILNPSSPSADFPFKQVSLYPVIDDQSKTTTLRIEITGYLYKNDEVMDDKVIIQYLIVYEPVN